MNASLVKQTIESHVPPAAAEYCFQLWQQSPFELKLTKTRQTKVCDFTSKRSRVHPRITLNHDLNPYLFLMTYIHEVAHLRVFLRFGNRVDAHGEEWKSTFTDLMLPVLWENVFPEEILHDLRKHMINPKASSFADSILTRSFRKFDKDRDQFMVLADVPEGSTFYFQGRYFVKGKLRRTRVICRELKSKRDYLVPVDAEVNQVQFSLL